MFTLTKINLLWDKVKALTAQVDAMAKIPRGSVVVGLMSGAATIPEAARNEIGDAFKKSIPCFIVFSSSNVFRNMYRVTQCYYDMTTGALTEIVAIQMKKDAVGHYYIDAKANNSWSAEATSVDESGYTPPNYSETEHDTGLKWTDGSTVYEKTIHSTSASGESLELVTGMSDLVSASGYIFVSSNTAADISGAYMNSNDRAHVYLAVGDSSNTIYLNCYGALRSKNFCITVRYTKPAPTNEAKKKTKKVKEED